MSNNIIDLSFPELKKQKIRIDNDDNRIIELDLSDMLILQRYKESVEKFEAIEKTVTETETTENNSASDILVYADTELRKLIDYIFNSNVCEVIAPTGSLYDFINGSHRYEYILDALMNLYDKHYTEEIKRMEKKSKSHTDKYTQKADSEK